VDRNNGGGFINIRPEDPDAETALRNYMADLRPRIGDEAFDRMQRSRELTRHPRPLTRAQTEVLWQALAPVLRDLEATSQTLPDIREEAHEDPGQDAVCAWIQGPGGTGEGIRVWLNGSEAFQLYSLAEQLQSWKVDQLADSGQAPIWPRCPAHPHADRHRLEPGIRDEVAVWRCPAGGQTIAAVGSLRHPDPSVAAKFDKHARRQQRRVGTTRRARQPDVE